MSRSSAERATFELHVYKDKRWTMDSVHNSEAEILSIAKSFVKSKKYDGVKVIREWTRADGEIVDKVIFEEFIVKDNKKNLQIVPIEQANHCAKVDDCYSLESRITINKILRKYLDEVIVTPTELLHSSRHIRRLADSESLLPHAVNRIAAIQAKQSGEDSKKRSDDLFKFVDKIGSRARKAKTTGLPPLKPKGFGKLVADIQNGGYNEDKDFLALTVLVEKLENTRTWLAKLGDIFGFIGDDDDEKSIRLVDGIIADILGSANVVQDLLGVMHSTTAALIALIQIAKGTFSVEGRSDGDYIIPLMGLFGKGLLPQSREVILDRVYRQLKGTQPLSRGEENEAFLAILEHLYEPDGFFGDGPMAEAMADRYARQINKGGSAGIKASIAGICNVTLNRGNRLRFLMAMTNMEKPDEFIPTIIDHTRATLEVKNIHSFCPPKTTPREKMEEMTRLQRLVIKSDKLPDEFKANTADRLDDLLARYIVDEKVIERLDNPDHALWTRALRLVQFCASGVLTEGKSLKMAREATLHHLRQPQFVEKFTASIPSDRDPEATVREFYSTLAKAGFSP